MLRGEVYARLADASGNAGCATWQSLGKSGFCQVSNVDLGLRATRRRGVAVAVASSLGVGTPHPAVRRRNSADYWQSR